MDSDAVTPDASDSAHGLSAGLRQVLRLCLILAVVALAGCARYHPKPLSPEKVDEALRPPSLKDVRLSAAAIKHPLLKAIPFDERNGLSPDEAAILAVCANSALRAARDRKGLARAQLLQAGILPNPELSYSFEAPVGGDTRGKITGLGLGLNWDIKSLLVHGPRVHSAKADVASIDLGVAWQEWQVAEKAKLQVYRVSIAQRRVRVAEKMRSTAEQSYKATKRAVGLGLRTQSDLSAAEMALHEAQSRFLSAQSAMVREGLALNRALGEPIGTRATIEKQIRLPDVEHIPTTDALLVGLEDKRLDLLALKSGYESQEARVRAAIRSQFPRISVGLTGSRDTDGLNAAGAGVTIELPFFERNQGRIAVERATRKQLFDEYVARLFEARAEVASIRAEVNYARMQLARIEDAISSLEQVASAYHSAMLEGGVDVLGYYRSLSRLYAKRLEMLDQQRRLVDLAVALEVVSGRYRLASNGSGPQQAEKGRTAEGLK